MNEVGPTDDDVIIESVFPMHSPQSNTSWAENFM